MAEQPIAVPETGARVCEAPSALVIRIAEVMEKVLSDD